jgi:hypothetical protein
MLCDSHKLANFFTWFKWQKDGHAIFFRILRPAKILWSGVALALYAVKAVFRGRRASNNAPNIENSAAPGF